jgi:hypothetical protein
MGACRILGYHGFAAIGHIAVENLPLTVMRLARFFLANAILARSPQIKNGHCIGKMSD